jgi:uncharacterized RDD family membrane protein YckC
MTELTLVPASPFRRLAALCYDLLLLVGLIATFTLLAVLVRGGVAVPPGSLWFQGALIAIVVAFFCGFWSRGGQTLGMRAWHIRVVSRDLAPLSARRALLRLAVGLVALLPVGLGLWWGFFDAERRGWADFAAGTRVVRVPPRTANALSLRPPA